MTAKTIGDFGPQYNDRYCGPVSASTSGISGNGKRYNVTTATGESLSGHLADAADEHGVYVRKSTRAKSEAFVPHSDIRKIEEARAGRDGSRAEVYSRPAHVQDGYGRKG